MKKFGFLIVFMSMTYNAYAMKNEYNPTDKECRTVALYLSLAKNKEKRDVFEKSDESLFRNSLAVQTTKLFLKDIDVAINLLENIPSISLEKLHSLTEKVGENVRFIAKDLSRSNMFVFVTFNQDFLTAMYQKCLPAQYEDRSGFFSEKSHSEVQIVSSNNESLYPVLSREAMIKKLKTFPLDKALYALSFVEIPVSMLSESRFERVEQSGSCVKVVATQYEPAMAYQWTFEDCNKFTPDQRALFDIILAGSNKYKDWQYIDKRFVVGEREIGILLSKDNYSAKELILSNKKYNTAKIKVDIASSTTWENFFNKILYCLPHAIVMIIPDLVQNQIDGMYNSALGVVLCAAGSFGFGEYVYPRIDSYNYNVHKLSQWFGPDNHRRKRTGLDFVFISVVSSLANLAGQKFLSWQALPWKILGGGIHAMRIVISGAVLMEKERIANRNPFVRTNKDGKMFTLQDLANGPKFNSK